MTGESNGPQEADEGRELGALLSYGGKGADLPILEPIEEARPSHSIEHDYVLTLGANILVILLGVVTGALTARALHPFGRGELASIQLWPSFLAVVATFGMPESMCYFSAKFRHSGRQYLTTSFVIAGAATAPLIVMAYFVLPDILHANSSVIAGTRLYLLFIPCYVLMFLPSQAIRGTGNFWLWNITRILPNMAWLVTIVVAYTWDHAHRRTLTPQGLTDFYLVGLAVVAALSLFFALRALSGPVQPDIRKSRELLRYGLPVLGATLPVTLNLRLDQLVMTVVVAERQLGLYVVAVAWSGAISPILNSIGSTVMPRIAPLSDQSDQADALIRVSRFSVLVAGALTIPILAVTPTAIDVLFGASFHDSITPAFLLVVASAFLGMDFILTEALLGIGVTSGPLRAQTIGFVMMAATLALFLPTMGIVGAALSSLVGYSSNALALVYEAHRATGASYRELVVPRRVDIDMTVNMLRSLIRRA